MIERTMTLQKMISRRHYTKEMTLIKSKNYIGTSQCDLLRYVCRARTDKAKSPKA